MSATLGVATMAHMPPQTAVVTISPDSTGWYSLERDIDPNVVAQLAQIAPIEKLSLTKIPLVTVKLAQRLLGLRVEQLWLWCPVTRRAMRRLLELPGLRVLDVLCLRGPGRMAHFKKAKDLQVLRANHHLTEADLLEVAQCAGLCELGAQSAELSLRSLSAILSLPRLASLDLEATRFDDRMARLTSRSKTITSLDLGGTRLTRTGLVHLVSMQQLRALDLWATAIDEADLKLLLNLPHLEYISLGNYEILPTLSAEEVTQFILDAPSLKRVWLDGMHLEPAQRAALEAKLESLRVTSPGVVPS